MFIGCILLVPIRIILIILSPINPYITARILCCDHDHAEVEYNTCKRVFAKFLIKWSGRVLLFATGVLWIKKKYYKISSWNSYKYGINKHINLLKNICKYNDIIIDKMQKTKKDNNNTEKKYIHYVVYRFNIPEIFI